MNLADWLTHQLKGSSARLIWSACKSALTPLSMSNFTLLVSMAISWSAWTFCHAQLTLGTFWISQDLYPQLGEIMPWAWMHKKIFSEKGFASTLIYPFQCAMSDMSESNLSGLLLQDQKDLQLQQSVQIQIRCSRTRLPWTSSLSPNFHKFMMRFSTFRNIFTIKLCMIGINNFHLNKTYRLISMRQKIFGQFYWEIYWKFASRLWRSNRFLRFFTRKLPSINEQPPKIIFLILYLQLRGILISKHSNCFTC